MTTHRTLLITFLLSLSAGAWCGPVNVNSADVETLARELKGIGHAKAQAIVDYRQKHGAFRSVDELAMVKGISQKLIAPICGWPGWQLLLPGRPWPARRS